MTFKRTIYFLLMIISISVLSACGKSIEDNLQSNNWDIVSTNGESYTGNFHQSTVSFNNGFMSRGFSYEIEDNTIILKEDGEKPVTFEINEDDDEYIFKSTTKAIKEQFGDLTLTPVD